MARQSISCNPFEAIPMSTPYAPKTSLVKKTVSFDESISTIVLASDTSTGEIPSEVIFR